MKKALVLVVAGIVVAGCGGTNIDSADKEAADRFFDGKPKSSQDLLCEQLSTAQGRADAVESVQGELGGVTAEDMLDIAYGSPEDQSATASSVAEAIGNGRETSERAESIVAYLADNRC